LGIISGILSVIYLFSCAMLVIVVLLQSGKGGGLAAAFGGGGGVDSAFGAKVASPLRKVTAVIAGLFMVLAIVLAVIQSTQPASILGEEAVVGPAREAPEQQPAPKDDEGGTAPDATEQGNEGSEAPAPPLEDVPAPGQADAE